jgi:archaellum component FlaG (FlaF/FlaG flagellin family)
VREKITKVRERGKSSGHDGTGNRLQALAGSDRLKPSNGCPTADGLPVGFGETAQDSVPAAGIAAVGVGFRPYSGGDVIVIRTASLALSLTAFLALPAFTQAQDFIPWANKFFSSKPEVPASIVHDFGTVPKGKIVTHRFKMTNIYQVPMTVVEPRPTCGCVSVLQYSPRLDVLEAGSLEIKLDTNKYDGGFKRVTIPVTFIGQDPRTGERFQSTADIKVQINSRTDINMTPGSINFGIVAAGNKPSQSLKLTYTGRVANWGISSVAYNEEKFDVKVDAEATRSGKAYTVSVTLKPGVAAGSLDEEIALNTNDTTAPVLKVGVMGKIEAAVTLSPSELKFGTAKVGLAKEQKVIIRAEKEFTIKEILGQDDEVTVSYPPLPPNKVNVFTVKYTAGKAGAMKKTLTVVTSTGDKVLLPLEALSNE